MGMMLIEVYSLFVLRVLIFITRSIFLAGGVHCLHKFIIQNHLKFCSTFICSSVLNINIKRLSKDITLKNFLKILP